MSSRRPKAKGVKVSVVNIMTMDFGAGSNDLADAESAAQGTAGQLASLYGISTSAAYAMMGLTPIAGELVNPNSGKCLDDTGFGGSGTQVQIWACADSSNQQWKLP